MNNKPLISIVTVTFNAESYIEETIKSIIEQSYPNIEYIIIDGKSTDGTVGIIKKYEHKITYWISEPDNGIYDAMNKGFKLANGDFIIFMNSGDIFYSKHVLNQSIQHFTSLECIYYGNVYFKYENNKLIFYGNEFNHKRLIKENICHQSIFYPKTIYKNNKYNLKYKLLADWEYNIRHFNKIKFQYIPVIIAIYDTCGISSKNEDKVFIKEYSHIIQNNFGYLYRIWNEYRLFKKYLSYVWKKIRKEL